MEKAKLLFKYYHRLCAEKEPKTIKEIAKIFSSDCFKPHTEKETKKIILDLRECRMLSAFTSPSEPDKYMSSAYIDPKSKRFLF